MSKIIHGMRNTRTYKSWSDMKQRCLNKNNDKYHYYGGRGIKICESWNRFENFYKDMGERPKDHTLDRIDTDGDYTPGNCRWANKYQQARNKRNSVYIEYNNESKTIAEWAELYSIDKRTLWNRINKGIVPPKCFLPVGSIPRGGAAHKTQEASKRGGM